MRILLGVPALAAALAAAASVAASPAPTVVGVRGLGERDALVQRFDAATLRPLGTGRRLGMPGWLWSSSPDRTRIVFVGERSPQGVALVVLDAATLQVDAASSGPLSLEGVAGGVQALAWPSTDRLVLTGWDAQGATLAFLVDARTRATIARLPLRGPFLAATATPRGLVGIVGRPTGVGPARVVALDDRLAVTDVPLPRIRAGTDTAPEGREAPARSFVPALAVDPTGRRAIVVGWDEPVADVDLTAGTVTWRGAAVRTTARRAKVMHGPLLRGFWLGPASVGVTGTVFRGLGEGNTVRQEPVGLQVLDLRSWERRVAARQVSWLSDTGAYLLWLRAQRGLVRFARDGGSPRTLFASRQVADATFTRSRALVRLTGESRVAVVDLATGRVVARRPLGPGGLALPLFLVGRASSPG